MTSTTTLNIRLRHRGEILPDGLKTEFELLGQVDHNWHWLIEHNGEVIAQILASNCHGMLLILRMTRIPVTTFIPPTWAMLALRRVLRDAKERGCLGFMVMLEDRHPVEAKLMRIAQKAGAIIQPFYGAVIAGSVEVG